jgi:N-acetylglucosaminyl-diphospho-decaprenol L-rhamnosyltransferase
VRIGAVTVNYNAGDHILDCVQSLLDEGVTDIIVVDNGSKDHSLAALAERFPDVPVIHLPNPGFGPANNVGVRQFGPEIDAYLLINPDAMLEQGAVRGMVDVLEANSRVGIVGPRVNNPDGSRYPTPRHFPSFVDGTGHAVLGLFWSNNPFSRRYRMEEEIEPSAGSVDWVSGATMLVRKEAWQQLGGFDDAYFMFLEDTDLCFRAHELGWDVVYEPSVVSVHVVGVSRRGRGYKMIRVHHRSLMHYYTRNARGVDRWLRPLVLAGIAVRLPIALGLRWLTGRKAH